MTSERPSLLETVEEIRRKNEQLVEVSDETKQGLSEHALTLMAIESAVNAAS